MVPASAGPHSKSAEPDRAGTGITGRSPAAGSADRMVLRGMHLAGPCAPLSRGRSAPSQDPRAAHPCSAGSGLKEAVKVPLATGTSLRRVPGRGNTPDGFLVVPGPPAPRQALGGGSGRPTDRSLLVTCRVAWALKPKPAGASPIPVHGRPEGRGGLGWWMLAGWQRVAAWR